MSRRERQRERNRLYKRKKRKEREAAHRNEEDLGNRAAGQAREERAAVVTVNAFDREVDALERFIRDADREFGLDCCKGQALDERVATPSVGGLGGYPRELSTGVGSSATAPGGGDPSTSTDCGITTRLKRRSRAASASSISSSSNSSSSSSSSDSSTSSSSSSSSIDWVGGSLTDQSASRPASLSSGYSSVDALTSYSRPYSSNDPR